MRPRDFDKQQRLHHCAVATINKDGFEGASVSKIARCAGVSPATLYLYFENKQDMIGKIYLTLCAELGEHLGTALSRRGEPRNRLKAAWFALYDYCRSSPENFRFLEQFRNCPLVDSISQEEGRRYFRPVHDLYESLRRERIIKPLADDLISAHLFSPLIHLMKLNLRGDVVLDGDTLEQSFQASWDAVRTIS